jgi:uncharacterized protein (DUF697 family)
MDYGEIFSKAWKIIWKYKILWLFGIFASCSGGGGNGGGGGINSGLQFSGNEYGYSNNLNNVEPWAVALIIAAVILLAIVITVIVIAVSTVGRAGLIQGAKMADENEDAQLTFSSIFNSVKPFFWRVVGLNLLIMVGYFAILMILGMIYLFSAVLTLGLALICLLPLCCVLIPVFWVLTTFVEMANVAVVVEDLSIIDGLKRGWQVFRDNLGEMIVMGLVLVLGGMIVGILIALPMIPIAIPLIMGIVGSASNETGGPVVSGLIFSGLCCAAYLPVLIVVGGIIRAYIGSAWTLTYLRLTRRPVEKSADLLLDELNNAIEDMDPKAPSAESETTDEIDEPADSTEDKAPDDTLPEDF